MHSGATRTRSMPNGLAWSYMKRLRTSMCPPPPPPPPDRAGVPVVVGLCKLCHRQSIGREDLLFQLQQLKLQGTCDSRFKEKLIVPQLNSAQIDDPERHGCSPLTTRLTFELSTCVCHFLHLPAHCGSYESFGQCCSSHPSPPSLRAPQMRIQCV